MSVSVTGTTTTTSVLTDVRQKEIQHQALEDFYRLLQLSPNSGHHRREDLYHARWTFPRSQLHGANQTCHATYRRP